MKAYEPWGRGGGGAPLRDNHGNLISKHTGFTLHSVNSLSSQLQSLHFNKALISAICKWWTISGSIAKNFFLLFTYPLQNLQDMNQILMHLLLFYLVLLWSDFTFDADINMYQGSYGHGNQENQEKLMRIIMRIPIVNMIFFFWLCSTQKYLIS